MTTKERRNLLEEFEKNYSELLYWLARTDRQGIHETFMNMAGVCTEDEIVKAMAYRYYKDLWYSNVVGIEKVFGKTQTDIDPHQVAGWVADSFPFVEIDKESSREQEDFVNKTCELTIIALVNALGNA